MHRGWRFLAAATCGLSCTSATGSRSGSTELGGEGDGYRSREGGRPGHERADLLHTGVGDEGRFGRSETMGLCSATEQGVRAEHVSGDRRPRRAAQGAQSALHDDEEFVGGTGPEQDRMASRQTNKIGLPEQHGLVAADGAEGWQQ